MGNPVSRAIPDPGEEPVLKASRVGAILDLSPRSTYEAIERGEIPSIRVGRSVRVPTAQFLAKFGLGTPGSEVAAA